MITSTSNQQVKQLIQLNRKRKLRDERGVFVAEGGKMFQEAPRGRVGRVYVSGSFFAGHREGNGLGGGYWGMVAGLGF